MWGKVAETVGMIIAERAEREAEKGAGKGAEKGAEKVAAEQVEIDGTTAVAKEDSVPGMVGAAVAVAAAAAAAETGGLEIIIVGAPGVVAASHRYRMWLRIVLIQVGQPACTVK